MICPYYKNKEVFNGFNEIVEAFGGKPMTEEEFRSADLRNERTGRDFAAMEAAYTVYDKNGGNFLDMTPTGKPSILFQTLLDYFGGDKTKAIVAKSNVYSDEFINWFGDWGKFKTKDTKNNLFTPTGEVNWDYFELLLDLYHNNQPDSMFSNGRYTLATRPENHFTGEKNTLNHIKFVTQSMLNLLEGKYDMDLPFVSEARASMQNQKDLMIIAAMFHDVAKPYRHGDIHGWESADILRDLLGVNYDNRVAEWAVRHHMPMPFSHKAEFSLSNPEAIEVAKNIARDARRVGIDANTAINAFVLINAADVINGRELNVDDNWAKKAGEEGLKKYGGDISVKNVLSVELKEKVALLKKAFDEIKDEDFGDTTYNYSHQERFDYQAFPEGGREDKKLPYLNNTEYTGVSKVVDENGEPFVVYHNTRAQFDKFDRNKIRTGDGFFFTVDNKPLKAYGNIQLAVYINAKNIKETDSEAPTADDFNFRNDGFDGMLYFYMDSEAFIIPNPNQIKHVENLGTWSPTNSDIYNIVIGEKGARSLDKQQEVTTRIDNLSVALKMENAGKDALTIKIATGWERGADGKWRYEIEDVRLKKDVFGEEEIKAVVGNDRNHYAARDISEVVDLSTLPTTYREELEYVGEIRIYDDFTEEEKGAYSTHDGKVIFYINLGANEAPESILAHEIQHFIQEREGFSLGGDPSISIDALLKQRGIYDVYQLLLENKHGYQQTLMKILSEDLKFREYEYISRKLDQALNLVDPEASEEDVTKFIKQWIPTWKKGVSYDKLIEQRKEELIKEHKEELEQAKINDEEVYKQLQAIESSLPSSYDAYLRLAGEVEARAAGRRTTLSMEERRNSLFTDDMYKDVAKEDLIFLLEGLSAGNLDTADENMQRVRITRTIQNGQLFETAAISDFGTDVMSRLINGEEVTSDELVSQLLLNESLSFENIRLAQILKRHSIPVKLDGSIGSLNLATTETNNTTGKSVILINPNLINKVTKGYLGEAVLHEVIHAVTVTAINNPSTQVERNFALLNKKVFDVMSKVFPEHSALFNDVDLGLYALKNEKEFAAVFITDNEARNAFYRIARQIDVKKNGKFLNTFKNFINSILHLFVNKNVFNTTESVLKQYQASFLKHLVGVPTQKHKKVSQKQIKELYDSIDKDCMLMESVIDRMKYIQACADAIERNNIRTITLSKSTTKQDDVTYSFDDIVLKLQIRVNALRTSDIKQSEKNKYINDTNTQIDMFRNLQTSKYIAITSTLRQIIPQVLKDVRELKNVNLDMSASLSGTEFMYQMHSNIGMYNDIAETMLGLLDLNSSAEDIITEYNKNLPEDQKITLSDLEEVKRSVQDLASITKEGVAILRILRDRTAKDILRKKAEKEGNVEDMDEYIKSITENPTFDDNISSFELWMGSMDSASNTALRALSSIVNRALKKADNAVIDKTTTLLELLAALKTGESVVDLYEVDEKGFTTGYLIRKLNYGLFYKNYDNELKRINKVVGDVIGKIIEPDARVAPDDETVLSKDKLRKLGIDYLSGDVSVRQAWNELRNKWLYDNCERKYNKKYYDAWNKVPQIAKDALDSINSEISSILSQPGIMDENGHYRYDKLSDEDWDTLLGLWIQKKLLRSDYDVFGNLKQEGSSEYKIAKALQQLNKDLHIDSKQKIKKDEAAWKAALDLEIEECGGIDAYNKWKNKEKRHGFNVARFKKWHMRNSRLEFKKDADGNAIIFQDIEDAMHGRAVDYGKEYNDLKEQADKLLNPYRAQNGEINASELPNAVKNILNEIYSKQYDIRQQVISNNPALGDLAKQYKLVFDQFIKFEDTEYYKQIKKEIQKASTLEDGTIDYDLHDSLLESYGHFIVDYETGIEIGFLPYRWLQRMEAIDTDTYMEYKPGDAWTEKVDNEDLLNKNFDANENSSFVPKKSKYDNSKKFAKIEKSKTLKRLYDEVVKTMHEANEMQSNRLYADDFLLPQITGSIWKRMKRHSVWGKTKALFKYLAESLGIGYSPNDFSQIGSTAALDTTDNEGNVTINNTPIQGQYPDGRTFHILPQYYTRKMDDTSQISSDLVNILSNYYKMSAYYKEKVAIKDDCETIVDFLEQRKTKSTKTRFKRGKNKDKSRLFNAAEKFLEMNLYDMRRSSTSFNIGPIELQWSKTVSLWKTWTTRRNLGLNPKVALTGFLTTMGIHIINTISGQNYGREGYVAFGEAIRRLFQSVLGARYLGNPLSNDDMMLMAEHYNVAGQAERKWEGTNRNRLVQAGYKNSVFGFLSTVDFWSKSIIMISILMNHHYVNGKFLSREDIRNSRHLYKSDKEFKLAMNEWKKGPNLYSLLKAKNNRLSIDDKYKAAFEATDDVIKDRVQKTTEYADGMATDLQRAAITQSVLGALVLIHKQYLPLIIQRYFGKRVYDYDTHQYKNGVFRTLFNLVGQLMQNNLIAGIGAGVFTGSAFGGFIGATIGGAAAIGVRAYGAYQHRRGKESKSVKLIFNEAFNDFSTKKSTAMSYANRYNMKEVAATVIGYRLIVLPLVGLVCSIADDDDDDKWWLLLLAYAMRAFEWEYYTAFRTDDMLNNVKSPTAATSVIDAMESLGGSITNTISPQGNFLFDPSLTWDDWENIFGGSDYTIQSGAYEDWQPWQRDIVKGTAFHNLYEQLKNSKAKRRYQENQIMRIRKPESAE